MRKKLLRLAAYKRPAIFPVISVVLQLAKKLPCVTQRILMKQSLEIPKNLLQSFPCVN